MERHLSAPCSPALFRGWGLQHAPARSPELFIKAAGLVKVVGIESHHAVDHGEYDHGGLARRCLDDGPVPLARADGLLEQVDEAGVDGFQVFAAGGVDGGEFIWETMVQEHEPFGV